MLLSVQNKSTRFCVQSLYVGFILLLVIRVCTNRRDRLHSFLMTSEHIINGAEWQDSPEVCMVTLCVHLRNTILSEMILTSEPDCATACDEGFDFKMRADSLGCNVYS